MTNPDDDMLDDMFAQARQQTVNPSDDLMARVLADADAAQQVATAPAQGLWARMLDFLGGWPAVSGLATATIAGVWIGVSPPASVEDLTASLLGDTVSVSLFDDSGFYGLEDVSDG